MRTIFLDYDARREPKTARFCVKCQKDISPDMSARVVRVLDEMVLHPEDAGSAGQDFLIGPDCAKALGLEYSRPEAQPLWRANESGQFERRDGALVWKGDEYHSNPLNPRCRMWEGAGPAGMSQTLNKAVRSDRRERFNVRRRFGSAEAAMQAVDRAYPPST
jgi:hypothetical protein